MEEEQGLGITKVALSLATFKPFHSNTQCDPKCLPLTSIENGVKTSMDLEPGRLSTELTQNTEDFTSEPATSL